MKLHATPSFTTERTFISVNPVSSLSSGRTTATGDYYTVEAEKKSSLTMIPIQSEHARQDMFQVDARKLKNRQGPSMSEQVGEVLVGIHDHMKKIGSILCC
jgi:hypothetical protein